jgi:hypothetical protein
MDYNLIPDLERIQRAMEAVKARGILVEFVPDKAAALERLQAIIPAGSDVMTAGSTTLTQIGLDDLLISGRHPWHNLKGALLAEKDPAKQAALRKQSSLADYFLGSVHAIAETGEIVVASATGSQLAPYVFSSSHVLWVAGAQKIMPTLEDALRRVREYVLPLEDRRMRSVTNNRQGSMIGKLLLFEQEAPYLHRTVTLLLVNEILGF